MNILVVTGWIHPDAEGGSFRVAYDIARGLALRGHSLTVITSAPEGDLPSRETVENMLYLRYRTSAARGLRLFLSTVKGVRRLTKNLEPDIVHLHHPFSALGANLSPSLRRTPRVITFHIPRGDEFLDEALFRGRKRTAPDVALRARALRSIDLFNLRRAEAIVVLSEFMRTMLGQLDTSLLERCVLIPGGVDTHRFNASLPRSEARRRLSLPHSKILFTLRRLEPRMGLENLIEAVSTLPNKNLLLLLGGRGTLEPFLRKQIERLNLSDGIRMLGYVSEEHLPLYYRSADCTIIPTRSLEGFGISAIESLACGTPVIATPVGGLPEIVKKVDESLIAGGTSPQDIKAAIARFLKNHQELETRCLETVRQHYELTHIIDLYEKLFTSINPR